jgi:hypothetical protein
MDRKAPHLPCVPSRLIVWGARDIAATIGRTERATFHMLERGQVPGARKIAGRWCLDPEVFFATFAA